MYLMHLSRRQLQSRCKQAGIRANTSNKTMAEALEKYELAKACASHAKKLEQQDEEGPAGSVTVQTDNKAASNNEEVHSQETEHVNEEAQETSSRDISDELASPLTNDVELPPEQQTPKVDSLSENKEQATEASEVSSLEEEGTAQEFVDQGAVKCSSESEKEYGTLAQELLANEEAPAVSAHRDPFKRSVIGQAGKGARLKRAAEKGSQERSTLIAERRRGALAKVGENEDLGIETTAAAPRPRSERVVLPVASTEIRPEVPSGVKASGDEKREHQLLVEVPVAHIEAPLGEPEKQPSNSDQKEGSLQEVDTEDAVVEDALENEDTFEEDKENALPSTPNESLTDAMPVDGGAFEQASDKILAEQERPIMLPKDTLVGTLLAAHSGDEKRVSSGQAGHRDCYKSRPFSGKGVEKRALAAAKKGMGEREAILAERRSLKVSA